MDNIIEWLVDNSSFNLQWYGLSDEQQEEFKVKFKEQILCQFYRYLDRYM